MCLNTNRIQLIHDLLHFLAFEMSLFVVPVKLSRKHYYINNTKIK